MLEKVQGIMEAKNVVVETQYPKEAFQVSCDAFWCERVELAGCGWHVCAVLKLWDGTGWVMAFAWITYDTPREGYS